MNLSKYRLATDGDDFERHYWSLFIKDQFPSYETFWLKFILPLRKEPTDVVNYKDNSELAKIGRSESDICIAQLNYTILRHLIRCFEIKKVINSSYLVDQFDLTLEGMTRLVGCCDIAFELLDRLANPAVYKAFDIESGKKAQKKRIKSQKNGDPIEPIRRYRNYLVHNRLPPSIIDGSRLCLPAIGTEYKYLDWREIIDFNNPRREEYKRDFLHISDILESAWGDVTEYLENNWKNL